MSVFLRAALVQAVLLGLQILIYFGVERFEGQPHDISRPIDAHVPFRPGWVVPYCLWFPLIAVFPLALAVYAPGVYEVYMPAIAFGIVSSTLVYILYPTSFTRPKPPETFFGRLMAIVYKGSYKGVNCAPSLHCSQCFVVMAAAVLASALPFPVRSAAFIIAVLIVLATQFTKQHVLIDALTAVPVAVLGWLFGTAFPASFLTAFIYGG